MLGTIQKGGGEDRQGSWVGETKRHAMGKMIGYTTCARTGAKKDRRDEDTIRISNSNTANTVS